MATCRLNDFEPHEAEGLVGEVEEVYTSGIALEVVLLMSHVGLVSLPAHSAPFKPSTRYFWAHVRTCTPILRPRIA